MDEKSALLDRVRQGLADGTITAQDLDTLLTPESAERYPEVHPAAPEQPPAETIHIEDRPEQQRSNSRLSIVDMLFYLAGLVLYAALMVLAFQAGGTSSAGGPLIMLICGLAFWTSAFILGHGSKSSDNASGFANATLLTGSLSVISSGVMLATYLSGSSDSSTNRYALAITFAVLGGLHLFFDTLMRRTILVVLGLLLVVVVFPTVLVALLSSYDVSVDVWTLIGIGTGLLTAGAGYVAVQTVPGREGIRDALLSIAGFIVMSSVYGASLSSTVSVVWSIVLPILIYVAFYVSIKRRNRHFLVTGSFFLVIFVITMAFKYFAGLGAAFSLAVSAVALLATAFMASSINKRYIKGD